MELEVETLVTEELKGEVEAAAGCSPGKPKHEYELKGPQVEPEAAYWSNLSSARKFPKHEPIRVVEIRDLVKLTDDPKSKFYVPDFSTKNTDLDADIDELVHLAGLRDKAGQIAGNFKGRIRKELSRYLELPDPPVSAIWNTNHPQLKLSNVYEQCERERLIIENGRELARMFEDETPGLVHRHALNCLLFGARVSPPRHARIWMALDVTIYSALLAAWYYKWGSDRAGVRYRQRPYEYCTNRFTILYDRPVDEDGDGDYRPNGNPVVRKCPAPSAGTPRHPAYPSGHSTYSAAASEILAHFFPHARSELENLADNIGMARLWAGIHWRSDHDAGRQIGLAVAERMKEQLRADPVSPFMKVDCMSQINKPRPSFATVEANARRVRIPAQGPADQDTILPAQTPSPRTLSISPNSSAF